MMSLWLAEVLYHVIFFNNENYKAKIREIKKTKKSHKGSYLASP